MNDTAFEYKHMWSILQNGTEVKDWLSNESGQGPYKAFKRDGRIEDTIIILAYGLLSLISFFGNSLVCYVIMKNKRLHTATNFFIANLAVADLLVTCINIPINIVRHLLEEWPLGDFLCHLVNFSLGVSVYVSTYTLTAIAIDRHRVVLTPLTIRMSKPMAATVLVFIWIFSTCFALPSGIYMQVQEVNVFGKAFCRCSSAYPVLLEKYLTVCTFILQYCIPFTLIAFAYGRIVRKLWARTHVGAVTENQHQSQQRAKRRTIKLLIAVVIVFAVCWFPLNVYHLLTDLHPNAKVFHHDSRTFFICHWIAISSTCYNPFVYCWMNEHFREEVKSRFRWCGEGVLKIHPGCSDVEGTGLGTERILQRSRGLTRSSIASSSRSTSCKRETLVTPDELDEINIIKEETTELLPRCDISNGVVEFQMK